MARTKEEIKKDIAANFMKNVTVAETFNFEKGSEFSKVFSKVSLFNILFEIFASVAFVIETLFDRHKAEVEQRIEQIIPHRPKWYSDKVMAFMKDKTLVAETDYYDTSEMSYEDITRAKVVKNAVVVERGDASILTIKVRGAEGKLDNETESQLVEYIDEIRDAGVKFNLVNSHPDIFDCNITVYYDPMLLVENIEAACMEAVKEYIQNLPFNGQFTNMGLIDRIQVIDGVKIVECESSGKPAGSQAAPELIHGFYVPESGWFTPGNINIKTIPHA